MFLGLLCSIDLAQEENPVRVHQNPLTPTPAAAVGDITAPSNARNSPAALLGLSYKMHTGPNERMHLYSMISLRDFFSLCPFFFFLNRNHNKCKKAELLKAATAFQVTRVQAEMPVIYTDNLAHFSNKRIPQ